MNLHGTYAGIVENVRDPERLGRVKARVPHAHGVSGSGAGYIGTNDLPWALPAGLPAGGSKTSGGLSHLPGVGDHVWIRFLDGEPEKPIWEWGMQTFADRDQQRIHSYEDANGQVGDPNAALWTRYAHAVQLNATGLILSTSQGYNIQLKDGQPNDGAISLETALGNFLRLDDADNGASLFLNQDWNIQVGESVSGTSDGFDWTTSTRDFSVDCGNLISLTSSGGIEMTTVGDVTVDSLDSVSVSAATQIDLISTLIHIGQSAATEPLILGTQMTLFLEALLIWLSTHTHGNGNNGSPTAPPIVPPQGAVPPTTTLVSATAFTV